jgi:thymidylate synthase
VIQLLKKDPHSRRILFTTYNPEVAKDGVLYPCHGLISQLYINEREGFKYLSLNTYQRSADAFLGLPFNIASYGALVYILCKIMGPEYKPDELIINLGDIHIYENHIDQCMEQIGRKGYKFPKLNIKDFDRQSLEEGDFSQLKYEDFELINYKSHTTIKADMIS